MVRMGPIDAIMADCEAPKRSILCINNTVGKTVTIKPSPTPYQMTALGNCAEQANRIRDCNQIMGQCSNTGNAQRKTGKVP